MTRNIKLTIEYDGTNFKGWQIQKKGERTVAGEITNALYLILKENVNLIGSGRTDSGVHAFGQTANFKTNSPKALIELHRALNANLPEDIAIVSIEDVPLTFHAQYSVKTKTYRYTVRTQQTRGALDRNFCLYFPHKLNLRKMQREIKTLIGKKDFRSFQTADPNKIKREARRRDTVRHIKKAIIKKTGNYIIFEFEADGFLYKMVRNMVGTLLDIGSGRLPEGCIKKILHKKDRTFAGKAAKPSSLCLVEVKY